jgi:hypothetical protein
MHLILSGQRSQRLDPTLMALVNRPWSSKPLAQGNERNGDFSSTTGCECRFAGRG